MGKPYIIKTHWNLSSVTGALVSMTLNIIVFVGFFFLLFDTNNDQFIFLCYYFYAIKTYYIK
jgi:hypothetical protein